MIAAKRVAKTGVRTIHCVYELPNADTSPYKPIENRQQMHEHLETLLRSECKTYTTHQMRTLKRVQNLRNPI